MGLTALQVSSLPQLSETCGQLPAVGLSRPPTPLAHSAESNLLLQELSFYGISWHQSNYMRMLLAPLVGLRALAFVNANLGCSQIFRHVSLLTCLRRLILSDVCITVVCTGPAEAELPQSHAAECEPAQARAPPADSAAAPVDSIWVWPADCPCPNALG